MVCLRSSFLKDLKTLQYTDEFVTIDTIHNDISLRSGIPTSSFILFYNGKCTYLSQKIPQDATIDVCLPLLGGKGGFGSMLRAIGAQIEKTTNREACRDLSGRRLRDINEEQRLKRWLSKKAEREAEQLERRKKRLERLKVSPKHEFHDPDYNRERSELPERIDDALSQGLKKASKLGKKSANKAEGNTEQPAKKKRKWLDDEISSDEEANDDVSQSSGENSQSSQAGSSESVDSDTLKFPPCDSASTSSCQMDTFQDVQVESHAENQEEEPSNINESHPLKLVDTAAEDEPQQELTQSKESILKSEDQIMEKEILHSIDNAEPTVLSQPKKIEDDCTLDLLKFESLNELENLGLDKLKNALTSIGLKCGGTLMERVQRLWAVRGLDPQNYPTALKAKKKKS